MIAIFRLLLPCLILSLEAGVPFVKMRWERMPDLNTARYGNVTLCLDGEIVTFGGHTDGFIPAATAEYYKDDRWHEIPMRYTHDFGFATVMPDGRVMLCGGSAEPFGIGQSWGVEIYDPDAHSFSGIGIMSRKRALASALSLDDGSVVVSGNWYADDDIEVYRPDEGFSAVSPVSEARHCPAIVQSGSGKALVFGGWDTQDQHSLEGWVDRYPGEAFRVPMLQEWIPEPVFGRDMTGQSIGEYAYLFVVKRDADGQYALCKVSGEQFSLLETDVPFPKENPEGVAIAWTGNLMVDRPSRCAFVWGNDSEGNTYLARVSYDATFEGGKAALTVFFARGPEDGFGFNPLELLPDGRFVMVGGGKRATSDGLILADNFATSKEVYVFSIQPEEKKSSYLALLLTVIGIVLAGWGILLVRQLYVKKQKDEESSAEPVQEDIAPSTDLMSRLVALMEEEQLFRKKDLKKADVAQRLGTNLTYITATVNSQTGKSFPELVTDYRIRYAQQLMKENPKMLLSEVGELSGFASEQSFFRTFKARTGLTPSEWKQK